jgi:hypothetical protein
MFNNHKMGSSDSLLDTIKGIMEKKHTTPETPKEKALAKLAHPKDKITHKDVLVGRGVLKKENSGDRMGVIVGTRKEKVELEPKLKEELGEAASFRVPAHVKKHLEDKHGPAQTILVSKDGSKIQHVVRHHDDEGADHYETRTHEYNGTAPIKDRKVGKLIKHVKPKLKEGKQVTELKQSTVKSYTDKANKQLKKIGKKMMDDPDDHDGLDDKEKNTLRKRMAGFDMTFRKGVRASQKTTKEEVENVDERKLTGAEAEKKEKYVLSMKKKMGGFKQRYGARAKEVMYATATKMAKDK